MNVFFLLWFMQHKFWNIFQPNSLVWTRTQICIHFNRIWISLRFIHTKIYFSKEAPEICALHKRRLLTENNTHKCDRKYDHEPNPLPNCPSSSFSSSIVWIRIKEQTNSQILWNIDSKPSQTKPNKKKWNLFILWQSLSVISIKRLQIHSNERALSPFTLVDFHVCDISSYTHSCVYLLWVFLPWPSEWHHWMHLVIRRTCGRKCFLAEVEIPPHSLIYDFGDGNILIYYIWIPDGHIETSLTLSLPTRRHWPSYNRIDRRSYSSIWISYMNGENFWIENIIPIKFIIWFGVKSETLSKANMHICEICTFLWRQ